MTQVTIIQTNIYVPCQKWPDTAPSLFLYLPIISSGVVKKFDLTRADNLKYYLRQKKNKEKIRYFDSNIDYQYTNYRN